MLCNVRMYSVQVHHVPPGALPTLRHRSVAILLVQVTRALLLGYVGLAKWLKMERVALVLVMLLHTRLAITMTVLIPTIHVLVVWYAAKMAHVKRTHQPAQKYDYPLYYDYISPVLTKYLSHFNNHNYPFGINSAQAIQIVQ